MSEPRTGLLSLVRTLKTIAVIGPVIGWAAALITGIWVLSDIVFNTGIPDEPGEWILITVLLAVMVYSIYQFVIEAAGIPAGIRRIEYEEQLKKERKKEIKYEEITPLDQTDIDAIAKFIGALQKANVLAENEITVTDVQARLEKEGCGSPVNVYDIMFGISDCHTTPLSNLAIVPQGFFMDELLIAEITSDILRVMGYKITPEEITVAIPNPAVSGGECIIQFELRGETRKISCEYYSKHTSDGFFEELSALAALEDARQLTINNIEQFIGVTFIPPVATVKLNQSLELDRQHVPFIPV